MLHLNKETIYFEKDQRDRDGNTVQNFYDTLTGRICTVRNNGGRGVTCRSKRKKSPDILFRCANRGAVKLVKVSPNGKLAVVQRREDSIDVVHVDKTDGTHSLEFAVSAKSKETILGVEWISNHQMIFITRACLELFQINEEKKIGKYLKSINLSVCWYIYYARSSLILVASGPQASILTPVLIAQGQFTRLKSIEVELHDSNTMDKLLDKDVIVDMIYGALYVMVLRCSTRKSTSTDVVLYELTSEPAVHPRLKYVFLIGRVGSFGMHVIDNMVVVHHQASGESLIFDVCLAPSRPSHSSLLVTNIGTEDMDVTAYAPQWAMFQPDVIIDPTVGRMYVLELSLEHAKKEIESLEIILEWLLYRDDSRSIFLSILSRALLSRALSLRKLRMIFSVIVTNHSTETQNGKESSKNVLCQPFLPLTVSQKELQSAVFIPMVECENVNRVYASNVLLQFLSCLFQADQPVEAYFLDFVVEALADAGEVSKLHQLVTYRVIGDSKALAFQLLSYAARCQPLYQSGVDILTRQKAADEIVEVLMEKGFVVDAVRYTDSLPQFDGSILKIAEASKELDREVQFALLTHLQTKKNRMGEDLSVLTRRLESLFEAEEMDNAEIEVATAKVIE